MPERSGVIQWTTVRDAIAAVDSAHPNTSAPTDSIAVGVAPGKTAWFRVYNAGASGAPSLVFTVYGKSRAGGTWARLGQLNSGTAVTPTFGQSLSVTNRIDHTFTLDGVAAWDLLWVAVTGTMGASGTCTVQYGSEAD